MYMHQINVLNWHVSFNLFISPESHIPGKKKHNQPSSFQPFGFQSSTKRGWAREKTSLELNPQNSKSVLFVMYFLSFFFSSSLLPIHSAPHLIGVLLLHQRSDFFLPNCSSWTQQALLSCHPLTVDFPSLKMHFLKLCSLLGELLCLFLSCFAATELLFPYIFNHSYPRE